MLILDGKLVSSAVRESLVPRIEKIKSKLGRAPHLTVVIVGDDIKNGTQAPLCS